MNTASDRGTAWTWWYAARGALVLMLLCGAAYPAVTALICGALFPHQATGSLIERGGVVVGSELVGQPFAGAGWFHGRPSAAGYDPFHASGSNWAPSNPTLRERAQTESARIAAANAIPAEDIPVDLIAASGSGVDPHISPAAALLQVRRVASARHLSTARVKALVEDDTELPTLGVLGQPRVNVLLLNLALNSLDTAGAMNDSALESRRDSGDR